MSKQWKCGTCGMPHEDIDKHYKEHHPGELLFDGVSLDKVGEIASEIRKIILDYACERVRKAGRVTVLPEDIEAVKVEAIQMYLAQKR